MDPCSRHLYRPPVVTLRPPQEHVKSMDQEAAEALLAGQESGDATVERHYTPLLDADEDDLVNKWPVSASQLPIADGEGSINTPDQ